MKSGKKRAGRRRRSEAPRHPGGKLVQRTPQEREADILATGMEARERVHKVRPGDLRRTEAGTVIGRLHLSGELSPLPHQSKAMYEAADEYLKARSAYQRAIMAPQLPAGGDLERSRGYDGSEGNEPSYVETCNRAKAVYASMRYAVLHCGQPLAMMALETIVGEDQNTPGLVGDLRCALHALVRRKEMRMAA